MVFSPKVVLIATGVCILLVAVLVVVIAFSGSQSPAEVVKPTFMHANQGKYSDANKALSSQLRVIQDQTGMGKQLWDELPKKGTMSKIEIFKEEVRGEGATVRYKIHFKDGNSVESEKDLLKEGGS